MIISFYCKYSANILKNSVSVCKRLTDVQHIYDVLQVAEFEWEDGWFGWILKITCSLNVFKVEVVKKKEFRQCESGNHLHVRTGKHDGENRENVLLGMTDGSNRTAPEWDLLWTIKYKCCIVTAMDITICCTDVLPTYVCIPDLYSFICPFF